MPDNSIPDPSHEGGHPTLTAAATWALCAPRLGARGRVRLAVRGKSRGFAGRHETALTVRQPAYAAAVYVYDAGVTRLLVGDMDPKRAAAKGAARPAVLAEEETADFAALIAACGGDCFTDVSPATGGRHVYVPWAAGISLGPMRRLAEALARRYLSFDPSPMINAPEGLVAPPGSWTGGRFRELTDDVAYVDWVLGHPNGPGVWSALLDALLPELESLERSPTPAVATATATASSAAPSPEVVQAAAWAVVADEDGAPMWRRPGGALPALSPLMDTIARTGRYDRGAGPGRYASDSEARMAVLAAAASCGWRLTDVAARLHGGHWPGLAGFYARYKDDATRATRLHADWNKAVPWVAGRETGREIHTRGRTHSGGKEVVVEGVPLLLKPPASPMDPVEALRQSRRWYSAVRAAERYRWTGPAGITKRRVLRAMVKAAQLCRSMVVGFGVRETALLAGLDHSTVAKTLRALRDEPDPFIDLVAEHHYDRPDIYRLTIPVAYAEAAAWRQWQPGRLGGIHPVFRDLGGPAALIYEHLTTEPIRTFDVPGLAGVSQTAAKTALRALAEHGLAERVPGGWVRGPADPGDVAEQLGVPERVDAIVARYRSERAAWRTFLEILEAGYAPSLDTDPVDDGGSFYAGPPPWVGAHPHAPPALVGAMPAKS
ncbi:hypothetical protein ACQP10_37815 (plasmid) [Streptosporangium sandarakinum]|uniref:hypothetical protein n=1 Tax=Streptosporangium sandarakinum TaxID=1260955 RepID=UPI003D8DC572